MVLKKISEWTFKWKMLFNPDVTKQAHKIIFSRKNTKLDHPIVFLNEAPVAHTPCQKHLGMHFDEKLNFNLKLMRKLQKQAKALGSFVN